jgi:predicted P-loop ATPase
MKTVVQETPLGVNGRGSLPISNDYLQERPNPRTAPPGDEKMSRAPRWVPWTAKKVEGKPKPSKLPLGKTNDPTTWTYFHAARTTLTDPKIAGLGFQMFGRSGIIGIDVDNCVLGHGEYNPLAAQLLVLLEAAGAKYHVELTPSGKGLRVFAGECPLPFHDFLNDEAGLEVYAGESARFLTFTGSMIPGFGKGPFSPLNDETIKFLGKYATKWKDGIARADAGLPVLPAMELPELTRRDDWPKLHPNAFKRIGAEHRQFLDNGALGKKYASASEHLFAVEQALIKHLKLPQAYQILISADGSWGVALEHRENNEQRAREFIWTDLQRASTSREKHEKEKASAESGWKECDIIVELTEEGARARILQLNQINALQKHPEWMNRLGFNVFDGRVTLDRTDCTVRQLAEMSAWLTEFLKWPYEPQRVVFEESVTEAAKSRPWNPVAEELRGLVWDGRPRIKKLAEALCGTPGKLDCDIMRKWLVGFVARGVSPGCQMDTVLCLREQEGGGFKTTFARVMAGSTERFSDAPGFGSDKDSSMLRGGMRIVELGEGVAVKRTDRHALKADVTRLDDHYRPPWGRMTEKRKRGFVYVLTANDIAFLRSDQDGLRRIWPMDCADVIDIEWIRKNRDQVLAEAVALYDAGEKWWWDKGHEPADLKARQLSAVAEDFLDSAVESVIADADNRERGYSTLTEIKRSVEGVAGVLLSTVQAQHLLDVLSKHGFRPQQRRIDGRSLRTWVHPTWTYTGEGKVVPLFTDSVENVPPSPPCHGEGGTEKDQ